MYIFFRVNIFIMICSGLVISQTLNFFTSEDLANVKSRYLINGEFKKEIESLHYLASEAIEESPFTITKYGAPFVSEGTINDYYSDSPYWWPVAGDPSAPYVRRDGERNPARFMDHKLEVARFYKGVMALAFLTYFTGDSSYGLKASELLEIWFIDSSTKMNPNLKYSQLIRNRTKPRGVGIIDGRRLALLIEGIVLLNDLGYVSDKNLNSIKNWYSEYLKWLTTSFFGLDEKKRGNNHGSWWAAQVVIISDFLDNGDSIGELKKHSRTFLLDNQIDQNAKQPLEEKRTRSLAYSTFNATAHSLLNSIFSKYEIDNWNYINKNGVSLINVIDYLIPFVQDPNKWDIAQIKIYDNSDPIFLALAGLQLNNIEYLKVYNDLSHYSKKDLTNATFDPMQIILDSVSKLRLSI